MAIGTPVLGTVDAQTAASTSSTPSYPATIAAGDLLVLFGFSGAASSTTFTTPAGFTPQAQLANTGNTAAPNVYLATKTAAGTETGTLTCTHGNVITTMGLIVIPGADPTTPLDIAVVTGDKTVSSTTISFLTQTIVTAGALGLYVASGVSTTITATPASTQGGWTELYDHSVASTRSGTVAYVPGLSAGATGAITAAPGWSGTSKDVSILIFVRPAATAVTAAPRTIGRRPRLLFRREVGQAPPPIAPQVQAPPSPRRPVRAAVVLRRRRPAEPPVAPQVVVTAPTYVPAPPRRGLKGIIGRRTRRVEVTPPQVAATPVLAPDTRRLPQRVFLRRRTRAEVVSPQVAVAPPVLAPDTRRRLVRIVALRRRTRVEVVPPQVAVAPPTLAPDTRRRITRGLILRRRPRAEVTPPQIVVTPPAFIPQAPSAKHLQRVAWRPRRRAEVTHGGHHAAPPHRRRPVVRGPARRRGRRPEVVPPQVTPAPPSYVPQTFRRGLKGWLRRARQGVTQLVTTAQPSGPAAPYIELIIPPRLGTLEIAEVDRTIAIPAALRTLAIPSVDRTLVIPAVTRTLEIPEV